jgi:lipopolysaccharide transport system ATP-binding protein
MKLKNYSSGMQVRLAFSVAIQVDADVLLIDEVLAVGDAAFQRKCLGKIHEVAATEGRTVLLVTHNPSVVLGLCTRALYLQAGRLAKDGAAAAVVADYLASGSNFQFEREAPAGSRAAIIRATISSEGGQAQPRLILNCRLQAPVPIQCALEIRLHDAVGQPVAFASLGSMRPAEQIKLAAGDTDLTCAVDITGLAAGHYGASLKLAVPFVESLHDLPHCLSFVHEFAAPPETTHVLQQSWGSGYFTLPAVRTA